MITNKGRQLEWKPNTEEKAGFAISGQIHDCKIKTNSFQFFNFNFYWSRFLINLQIFPIIWIITKKVKKLPRANISLRTNSLSTWFERCPIKGATLYTGRYYPAITYKLCNVINLFPWDSKSLWVIALKLKATMIPNNNDVKRWMLVGAWPHEWKRLTHRISKILIAAWHEREINVPHSITETNALSSSEMVQIGRMIVMSGK